MGNSDHGTTYMRVGGDEGELRPWHYIYGLVFTTLDVAGVNKK